MDFSSMSDEELERIANGGVVGATRSGMDFSKMSDEELERIARGDSPLSVSVPKPGEYGATRANGVQMKPEDFSGMGERGGVESALLNIQRDTGIESDYDGTWGGGLKNALYATGHAGAGRAFAGAMNKNLQFLAKGTDADGVPLEQLPDNEVDYLMDSAGANGAGGWFRRFLGAGASGAWRGEDNIMRRWDETDGAKIEDPAERKRARIEYAREIARGMIGQTETSKQRAAAELEGREETTAGAALRGLIEQGGYTLPFIAGSMLGGTPGSFLLAGGLEGADRYNELRADRLAIDADGNIGVEAAGDEVSDAAGKALLRGIMSPTIEMVGGKAASALGGKLLGATIGKVPLFRKAGNALAATKAGRAVDAFAKRLNFLGRYTGMQGMPEEMAEELEDQVLDAAFGIDRRESEKREGETWTDRAGESFADFFKGENLKELATSMLLMQVIGGAGGHVADRIRSRHIDGVLREVAGVDASELKYYTADEKMAAFKAWADGLTEDEIARNFDKGAKQINRMVADIRRNVGENQFAETDADAPKFNAPMRTNGDGQTLTDENGNPIPDFQEVTDEAGRPVMRLYDAESGVTIDRIDMGDGDVQFRVTDAAGRVRAAETYQQAVERANQMLSGEYLSGAKRQYLESLTKPGRMLSGMDIVAGDSLRDVVDEIGERYGAEAAASMRRRIGNPDEDTSGQSFRYVLPDGRSGVAFVLGKIGSVEEMATAAMHEAGRHAGLDMLFDTPQKKADFLKKIDGKGIDTGAAARAMTPEQRRSFEGELSDIQQRYGLASRDDVFKTPEAVEELFAYFTENEFGNASLKNRFVAGLRSLYRDMFDADLSYNDADLLAMAGELNRRMRENTEAGRMTYRSAQTRLGREEAGDIENRRQGRRALREQERQRANAPAQIPYNPTAPEGTTVPRLGYDPAQTSYGPIVTPQTQAESWKYDERPGQAWGDIVRNGPNLLQQMRNGQRGRQAAENGPRSAGTETGATAPQNGAEGVDGGKTVENGGKPQDLSDLIQETEEFPLNPKNSSNREFPVGTIVKRSDGSTYIRVDGELEDIASGEKEPKWQEYGVVGRPGRYAVQSHVIGGTSTPERGGAKIITTPPRTEATPPNGAEGAESGILRQNGAQGQETTNETRNGTAEAPAQSEQGAAGTAGTETAGQVAGTAQGAEAQTAGVVKPKTRRGQNLRGYSYEDYAAHPDDGGTGDEIGASILRFARDNGGLLRMPPKGAADPFSDWIAGFLDGNAKKNRRGDYIALFGMRPRTGTNDALTENMPSDLQAYVENMIEREGPEAVVNWFLETRRNYAEWAANKRNAAREEKAVSRERDEEAAAYTDEELARRASERDAASEAEAEEDAAIERQEEEWDRAEREAIEAEAREADERARREQAAPDFALESATPEQLKRERNRQAQREEIRRRQEAELRGSAGETGQTLFDLGGSEGEDLFNRTQRQTGQGGAQGGINAPKRLYTKEGVTFKTPIVGKTGAKVTGYVWPNKGFEYTDKNGNDRVKRISDWDFGETSEDTGRQIIHQFTVEMSDGSLRTVSAESAAKLLGISVGEVKGDALRQIRYATAIASMPEVQKAAFERKSNAGGFLKPDDSVTLMKDGNLRILGWRGKEDGVTDRWHWQVTTITPDGKIKTNRLATEPKTKGFKLDGADILAQSEAQSEARKPADFSLEAATPEQLAAGNAAPNARERLASVYAEWAEGEALPAWADRLTDAEAKEYADLIDAALNVDGDDGGAAYRAVTDFEKRHEAVSGNVAEDDEFDISKAIANPDYITEWNKRHGVKESTDAEIRAGLRKQIVDAAQSTYDKYRNSVLENSDAVGDNEFLRVVRDAENVEDFVRGVNGLIEKHRAVRDDWASRSYKTSRKRVEVADKSDAFTIAEGETNRLSTDYINERRRRNRVEGEEREMASLRESLEKVLGKQTLEDLETKYLPTVTAQATESAENATWTDLNGRKTEMDRFASPSKSNVVKGAVVAIKNDRNTMLYEGEVISVGPKNVKILSRGGMGGDAELTFPRKDIVGVKRQSADVAPQATSEDARSVSAQSPAAQYPATFKRGDTVMLRNADGQYGAVTFVKDNGDGTANVQRRTANRVPYLPAKVENLTVQTGDLAASGMKRTLTEAEREAERRGRAEDKANGMDVGEANVRWRRVADPKTISDFDSRPHRKVYHSGMFVNGVGVVPPMASKVKYGQMEKPEWNDPANFGDLMESEEHPELVIQKGRDAGKFPLDKYDANGNRVGNTVPAAYAPYLHMAATPENPQFTQAWERPDVKVYEYEIDEDDTRDVDEKLKDGTAYTARGSKKSTGANKWPGGRTVYLVKMARLVREMPWSEVADMLAPEYLKNGTVVPWNTVPQELRDELRDRGVKIGDIKGYQKGPALDRVMAAKEEDERRYRERTGGEANVRWRRGDSNLDNLRRLMSGKGSAEVRWRRAIPELKRVGMYGGDMRKHMEQMRKQTFPDGTDEKEGAESIVIRTGDRVVKYRYARDLSGRVFDKIQWHNELFGDKTPYEVREVVSDDDWNDRPPRIVLEQPYVEIREGGGAEARRRLVEDMRRRFGAENVTVKGDPASERMEIDAGPYHISDLKDLNVGIDERTGDYAVWDANIEKRKGADADGEADVRWRRVTPAEDAAYMDAVERGDMGTARRMVREAATRAGYDVFAYHGTKGDFTVFDKEKIGSANDEGYLGRGFYFWSENNLPYAHQYAGADGKVMQVYLKAQEPHFIEREELESLIAASDRHDTEYILSFTRDLKNNGYDSVVDDNGQILVFDSNAIKSADPVTRDDAGNVIPLSQRFNAENADIRWRRSGIYTGTAADYANESRQGGVGDGPSLHHVGTGEGSQVYGWGLYGSTERGVAETYAHDDSLRKTGLAQDPGYDMPDNGFPQWAIDSAREKLRKHGWNKDSRDKAISEVFADIDKHKSLGHDKFAEGLGIVKNILEKSTWHDAIIPKGYGTNNFLYEQTFFTDRAPGDESHLLKWYEPVSEEQIEWIRSYFNENQEELISDWMRNYYNGREGSGPFALDRSAAEQKARREWEEALAFNNRSDEAATGKDVYTNLSEILGPQAASEFLARAGIDGVKYPVDSYGGKGVKDGDEAGWNYVSFRDDNIRVDHKWRDGQLLWRRTYTPNQTARDAADNGPLTQREVDEINSVMPVDAEGRRRRTSRDRQERAAREQTSRDAFARAFHNAGTWQRVGMLLDKNTRRDAWRAVKESAIRKMQDAGLDLRKYEVRRFERQFGKPMSRWTNAEKEQFASQSTYYAMDRAFGRKENLSLKLNQDYVKPLEKQIAENGLDEAWTDERGEQNIGADGKPLSKLDVYLMALHGGEYNRMIAERTARADGGPVLDGSGRSTEYWERQLARFRNEGFDRKAAEAVRLVHEMNKAALQQMVDSGRISQKQADKWNELSPNYVPLRNSDAAHDLFEQLLFGGDIDEQTYRKAFSGTEYNHAAGRRSLADSPVINSIQQAEWAIARSMDNESRRSLAAQVRADPRMGTVVMQMSQSDFQEAQREIAVFTQMEADGTITPAQRDRLARLKQNVADTIAGNRLLPRRRMLNQNSEVQSVIDVQGLEDDPNVGWVAFKENGDTKYIKLGHHELVDANGNATGNMDELTGNRIAKFVNGQSFVKLGGVMRFVRNLSRGFGMLRTSLSPTFLFSNFLADNGQALRNVFHTLGAGAMRTFEGHAADMGKNGARASALRYLRGQLDPNRYAIDRFTKEWAEAGGQIGGFATESFGDIDERMAASLRRMQRRLSRGKGGWADALKDGARALGERFQELNSAIEMATRISAYATMRENGMGVNDAVSYARDVTVNFNRKGEWTPIFNALYVFSNANIQDMQRTGMTFTGSRAAKLNGTLFVLGLLSAALGFGQDEPDDEAEGKETWENASEYRKQNGISFRVGGKVISLPLRGLARMPYYAGHKAFEALTGRRDAKDVAADIGSFMFSAAAEPLSTTSSLAQSVAPSILRPAVELIENKSFTGAPIHRTKMSETQVASEMGRQSTSGMAVWLARTLNSLTGGNRNRSGLIDVFPETLEQIGRGLAGTLGTDLMKGVTLAKDIATFQAPATRDVPFVSRVASDMEKNSRRYHEAVTDFERDQKEYKDLAQEDPSVMTALRRNSPWFREGNEMWYNELDSLRKLNKKLMVEETKADGKEREALNELRMKTQGLFLWRLKHAPESDAPAKRAEYGQRNRLIDRMLRGRAAARKREERTARR